MFGSILDLDVKMRDKLLEHYEKRWEANDKTLAIISV